MTHSNPRTKRFAAGAILLSALVITGCSGSADDEGNGADSSPSITPSSTRTAAETSEKQLTQQAQAALAAVQGGTLVEAGAERVSDGIHTEPELTSGKAYKLNLVCVGTGSAQLTFSPASAGKKATVPCDRSVVQQRITADKAVRIDVDGTEGSTGVIAWQIDTV
ncbi:hypothetical protein [Streptomyces griseoruber]|uniref:hypothetical protein n=1 Tax=Streptomyces griseoruber TaxID=1943 RepID=UPI0037B2A4ED